MRAFFDPEALKAKRREIMEEVIPEIPALYDTDLWD